MTAQDLKNSILQQAIQGKLLTQNPADEPASELLKKISAQRQKLIDEGKIKNSPQLSPISDDEKPFDIPESWTWVRLGTITMTNGGYAFKSTDYTSDGFRVIRISDFNKNGFLDKDIVRYKYDETLENFLIHEKEILLCMTGGTVGKSLLVKKIDEPLLLNQRVAKISVIEVFEKYIHAVISSPQIQNLIQEKKNSTNDNISMNLINNFCVPLPPLPEQKRIVEKLEEILPLVERYDELEQRLTKLDKEFPDKLKKSLLQQAIQGQLTKQLTTDCDAKDLLEKIREEKSKLISEGKIKKEKPLPPIKVEEIPFDIPENWKWVRLGEIINLISGQDLSLDCHNTDGNGVPYITGASNIVDEKIMINRWTTSPTTTAEYDDLLLSCKGTVGKIAFLKESSAHIARQIMAIKISNLANKFYIKFFIEKNVQNLKSQAKSMIPGISRNNLLILPLPLPPLAEQKRIVERLEELLPLCDKLKEKFSLM